MIARLFQPALCLCLSPLLAAQQVNQEAAQQAEKPVSTVVWAYPTATIHPKYPLIIAGAVVPDETPIELIPLDSLSSATAIFGATVRFTVAQDVVQGGMPLLRAGARIDGQITGVRVKKPGDRNDESDLRVEEVTVDRSVRLRLTAKRQTRRARIGRKMLGRVSRGLEFAAMLPLVVLSLLVWLVVLLNCKDGC